MFSPFKKVIGIKEAGIDAFNEEMQSVYVVQGQRFVCHRAKLVNPICYAVVAFNEPDNVLHGNIPCYVPERIYIPALISLTSIGTALETHTAHFAIGSQFCI